MRLVAGTRLGRYEIGSLIGVGGMGEVYRARDPKLGCEVAVKVLPASEGNGGERLRRFEKDARAAAELEHPNILSVHDVGVEGGVPFIVTELCDPQSIRLTPDGSGYAYSHGRFESELVLVEGLR